MLMLFIFNLIPPVTLSLQYHTQFLYTKTTTPSSRILSPFFNHFVSLPPPTKLTKTTCFPPSYIRLLFSSFFLDWKKKVSKFKQQTLPAWRPILTPKAVLPMFVIIGLIFIGVGSWLIVENNSVQEVEIDYTTCEQIATGAPAEDAGASCGSLLSNKSDGYINHEEPDVRCQCEKSFQISGFSGEAAYLYYALEGTIKTTGVTSTRDQTRSSE